jgi:hypothetical protein
MKKVSALFLLSLFLFNLFGYYFIFSYEKHLLQHEMKSLIRSRQFEGPCVTIEVVNPGKNQDYQRINREEFIFRGNLYDIVSEQQVGNLLILRCINDRQEEKLIAGYHQYLEFMSVNDNPAKVKHLTALLHHVLTIALPVSPDAYLPAPSSEISYFEFPCSFPSVLPSPSPPPPWIG